MSRDKRKREDAGASSEAGASRIARRIKVSHAKDYGEQIPVLASSPGTSIPENISFKAYVAPRQNPSRSSGVQTEILLHSSQHQSVDYVIREEGSGGAESFLKHYIGIYDPERARLQLIPARQSVIRSTVRAKREEVEKGAREEKPLNSQRSARNELGLAFGTKKSQKAIKDLTANAIQASPAKASQNGDNSSPQKLDPLAEAVVYSMADATSSMPTRDELRKTIEENKPRPTPHLDATAPEDVYPLEELVGGEVILERLAVKGWVDTISSGGDVPTRSRFVAHRIVKLVEQGDIRKLRALRYILLLVEWYLSLKVAKGGKRVPKEEDLRKLYDSYGADMVKGIGKRFGGDGTLNKRNQHFLLTHILALALHIDDYVSDTYHIGLDLHLEQRELALLHNELGCPLRPATERERGQLYITKAEAPSHRHTELKIPLTFRKTRVK